VEQFLLYHARVSSQKSFLKKKKAFVLVIVVKKYMQRATVNQGEETESSISALIL